MVGDIRKRRLESLVMHRVASLLSLELSDPRTSFITVTRVELDREIKYCTIFYSILGGPKERSRTANLLHHARGHVRSEIAKVLSTRTIPDVRFQFDESIEKAIRVERLIDEAAAEARRLEATLDPPAEVAEPEAEAPGEEAPPEEEEKKGPAS